MPDHEITLTLIYNLLQDHTRILQDHTRMLQHHTGLLQDHTGLLQDHTGMLQSHTGMLQNHTGLLQDHTGMLQDHTGMMQNHTGMMQNHTGMLQDHTGMLQDHTGRLDRLDRIESVQNKMALRLIDVEATAKESNSMLRSMQFRLDSLHGLVEELERRTGRIEQEYVMITEALRRLENRFDRIEAERLKERIDALEARVQALETTQA